MAKWHDLFGKQNPLGKQIAGCYSAVKRELEEYQQKNNLDALRKAAQALCQGLKDIVGSESLWSALMALERQDNPLTLTDAKELAGFMDKEAKAITKMFADSALPGSAARQFVCDVASLLTAVATSPTPDRGKIVTLRGQISELQQAVCNAAQPAKSTEDDLLILVGKGVLVLVGVGVVAANAVGFFTLLMKAEVAQKSAEIGVDMAGLAFGKKPG